MNWLTTLSGREFKILRLGEAAPSRGPLDTPEAAAAYLRERIPTSPRWNPDQECFAVLLLSTRLRAIGWEIVSNGTLDTVLVHPREVFKPAIVLAASAIVMAHNHPSGDPNPSEADVTVTRELIRAGQLLKIPVQDHIILGRPGGVDGAGPGHVSLRERGYFY